MIVLFHTLYMMTSYASRIIAKSVFSKTEDINEEQKTISDFILPDNDTHTWAEFNSRIGIRFFPPVYCQRYNAVKNILQHERLCGKIRKVVDFGCAEFGFFPYLKHIPGLQEVVSVDIDREMLEHYCCRAAPLRPDYLDPRQEPLTAYVLSGSVADRDSRLLGADAVICIELIEHLYPDTLEEVPYTVFGFIKPLVAIFTTPNSDFNVLFPNFTGFRHPDHKFEWSPTQFEDWATNITTRYPAYVVKFRGIGQGPKGTEMRGCCSQMAVFVKLSHYTPAVVAQPTSQHEDLEEEECGDKYVAVRVYSYPFHVDNSTNKEKILHKAEWYIRLLANDKEYCSDVNIEIPLQLLLPHVKMWCNSTSVLRNILKEAGWEILHETQDDEAVLFPYFVESESSLHESEDLYCEGQVEREADPQESDDWEENWDEPQVLCGYECGNCVTSQFMEDMSSVQLEDSSCGISQPQYDVHLQRNRDTKLQEVTESSDDSYKNREDDTYASSEVLEWNDVFRSYKCVDCITLRDHSDIKNSEKIIKSTSECSNSISTNLNIKDDVQSLAGLESAVSVEQTSSTFTGHSLVESCSLDEQNDRAADSGCPNSFSVQDMDMDLTPEQVDELSSESDEIVTENSDDSEYYDSESNEEIDHIENNDGLLFQVHHEVPFDPIGLVVENGDVANNNRDGEGNNAVAVIDPRHEPEVAVPADDLIPLLAAAEDFDNDNDLILPDDEPFPHWLLNLLGVANHGGDDLQNYMIPPVDDGFFLPDEGVGDIDNGEGDSDESG